MDDVTLAPPPAPAPRPQTMTLEELQSELESMWSLTILQDGSDAREAYILIGPDQALALKKASELLSIYIIPRKKDFIRDYIQGKK